MMMTWEQLIKEEEQKEYFIKLQAFLKEERKNKIILPAEDDVFNAFKFTPLENVKVVILGQDPYPTIGVPMGLAFSVKDGIKVPMSLKNIYKEIYNEFGYPISNSGNLTKWAKEGVFLLNQILTVEASHSLSHKNKGWEVFTKRVIEELNNQDQKMVFILFGNEAIKIKPLLTNPNHLVLTTSHPSPLSARVSFFGSDVFKKTSNYLNLPSDFWRIDS